jgi:hypothetical protein
VGESFERVVIYGAEEPSLTQMNVNCPFVNIVLLMLDSAEHTGGMSNQQQAHIRSNQVLESVILALCYYVIAGLLYYFTTD